MTRILQVVYGLNAGGIESFVMNIYRHIDREKIQFDFLVLCDPNEEQFFDLEIRQYGGQIFKIGDVSENKSRKYFNNRKRIKKFFKTHDYPIVHIHSGQIDKLLDVINCRLAGTQTVIVHSHNNGLHRNAKFYKLRVLFQKVFKQFQPWFATDFFTCSMAAANWAFPKRIIKKNKVKMIQNGIEVKEYIFSEKVREEYRNRLSITDEELLFGHVGRFNYQKNHDFLIDIFNSIHLLNKNSKLLLIGEGDLQPVIEKKVREIGLEQNVIFLGKSNEVNKWLSAMDAFILPSYYEGLPVVGVEAQAASLPMFISDTVTKELAFTELIRFLSLSQKAEEWAEYILKELPKFSRRNTTDDICVAGYDVPTSANYLQEYYLMKNN